MARLVFSRRRIRPEAGKNIHPFNAKLLSNMLFRRFSKRIKILTDFDINKAHLFEDQNELCFQQSTGNSASPEVYIPLCTFGENAVHNYI